jgi:hypothetical protein
MIYWRQRETPSRNRGDSPTRRAITRLTYLLLPRSYSKHAAWSNGRRCRFSKEEGAAGLHPKLMCKNTKYFRLLLLRKVAGGREIGTTKAEAHADATLAGRYNLPGAYRGIISA